MRLPQITEKEKDGRGEDMKKGWLKRERLVDEGHT